MKLTAEQLQIASAIDGRAQQLAGDGNDDLLIFGQMVDAMPAFKRLMDISDPRRNGRAVPAVLRALPLCKGP